MTKRFVAATALLLLTLATPAHAVLPSEQLADPVLEARAREISKELRCVVCQNQSIDDSDAPLAADLRVIVREQLRLGKTDAQAKDYLVTRYGSYVLLRPPFRADTWLLWLGPFAVLLGGAALVAAWLRARRGAVDAPALSAQEQAQLDALVDTRDVADTNARGVANTNARGVAGTKD